MNSVKGILVSFSQGGIVSHFTSLEDVNSRSLLVEMKPWSRSALSSKGSSVISTHDRLILNGQIQTLYFHNHDPPSTPYSFPRKKTLLDEPIVSDDRGVASHLRAGPPARSAYLIPEPIPCRLARSLISLSIVSTCDQRQSGFINRTLSQESSKHPSPGTA